jgi:glycosyltransferase involved in cell wall biosynthesis
MDVSVVIACKNEARYLGTMLDSLARQSFDGSWEVIVADNGSTDDTRAVAESYATALPRLVVLDASAEPGYATARNQGVSQARGGKILFVDGDDEVNERYVAAMAAALDAEELVCARVGFERLNPPWVPEIWPNRWQQDRPLDDFGFLPFAGSGTLGVRRKLFDEIEGFRHGGRPSQFEECDFCWRIQLAGHPPPTIVPDAVLHYRLPGTMKGMYRRGRNYARGQLVLRQAYAAHGMPPLRRVTLRDVAGAARRARRRPDLARTAQVLGRYVGQRSWDGVG